MERVHHRVKGIFVAHTPVRVGNVEIECVTDAVPAIPLEMGFPSVPADDWAETKSRYPDAFDGDSFKPHMGAYWLRCEGGPIVVDTGLGPRPVEMLGGLTGVLPESLAGHGLDPAEAALVFHTHAHFDHVGWNTTDGTQRLFPNARHLLHRADWETFHNAEVLANFPPYVPDALDPIEAAGAMDLLDGEQSLTPEVTAIPTPGHTPGHMSLLVSSAGEQAIITGDVLASPGQVTNSDWAFGFDMDPNAARETRSALLDRIEAEGMTMITCHFPAPGAGTIIRVEGRRFFQGVALT